MERKFVFDGMPTLLSQIERKEFESSWPISKELPQLVNRTQLESLTFEQFDLINIIKESAKKQTEEVQSNNQSNIFKLRKVMQITDCPHKDKKHYAKNMCSDCYSKRIKQNKVTTCGHPEKPVFARRMCLQCYTSAYKASKKET